MSVLQTLMCRVSAARLRTQTTGAFAVAALLSALVGCQSDANVSTETHWLRSCSEDAQCGALACVCGVCSLPCTGDRDCPESGGPFCASPGHGAQERVCVTADSGLCTGECMDDGDCAVFRPDSICVEGLCTVPRGTDVELAASGKFFRTKREPFLLLGDFVPSDDTALSYALTNEQIVEHLEARQSDGYTVVTAPVFLYGSHEYTNLQGQGPLVDGDASRPNESFFEQLDFVVAQARRSGLRLQLECDDKAQTDAQAVEELGRFLGNRYRDEPHIIWSLGHHWDEDSPPREVVRAMAQGLVQGVTGVAVSASERHPAWDKLIMKLSTDGGFATEFFDDDPWLRLVGYETWNDNDDEAFQKVLDAWALPLPTVDAEPALRGFGNPARTRLSVWRTRLGGSFSSYWAYKKDPAQDHVELARMAEFFAEVPWWEFEPAQALLLEVLPESAPTPAVALGPEPPEALVYLPAGVSVELDASPWQSEIFVRWFDPRGVDPLPSPDARKLTVQGGAVTLKAPAGFEDAVACISP